MLALGLFIAATQIILVLPTASFALILSRQILTVLSRALLVYGCWKAYQPPCPGIKTESGFTAVPTFTGGLARLMSRDRTSKDPARNSRVSEPLKLKIGEPVEGTFRRLSTEATRDFYDALDARSRANIRAELPRRAERVVFRTPARRAPALSFTSSIFSNQAMSQLASALNSDQPNLPTATSVVSTQKNYGSIYRPMTVNVGEAELSQWPPIAPPARSVVADQQYITHFSRPSYSQPRRQRSTASRRSSDIESDSTRQPAKTRSVVLPARPPKSRARSANPFARILADTEYSSDAPTDDTFGMIIRPAPRRTPTITRIQGSVRSNSIPRKPIPADSKPAAHIQKHRPQRSIKAEVFPLSVGSAPSMDLCQFPSPPPHARGGSAPTPREASLAALSIRSPETVYSTSSDSIRTMSTEECKKRTSFFFATPVQSPIPKDTSNEPYTPSSDSTSSTFRPRMTARKSSEIMSESPFEDWSTGILGRSDRKSTASDDRKSYQAQLPSRLTADSEIHFVSDRRTYLSMQRLRRDAGITPDFRRLRQSFMELKNLRDENNTVGNGRASSPEGSDHTGRGGFI